MDIKEAYEILGAGRNASKNEIERRYAIMLKKHRLSSLEGWEADEALDIQKITSAYNLLMGYEEPQPEEKNKVPNPLIKKMGIDEKKARNFLHYYKIHIILGVIALVVIAFTIKGCVTKVEPDFNMAFVGQIFYNETDILKEAIKAKMPEIKEPGFDGAFISGEGSANGQQEYAMQMKAMVLFAAAEVDLFILDKSSFDKYAKEGAFISLDEIATGLGVDTEKSKPYRLTKNEDTTEHTYGIDISSSEVLKKSNIQGKELIAAIPARSKQPLKAEKVISFLLGNK